MPWLGFAFVMGHMSVSHIQRQVANNPASVDVTGAQMVLLMKLSAFCWNVADGRLPEDQLTDFQKERMLRELPSILDFAGYVLFFPSLMVGPAFDYADYRQWIDTTMFNVSETMDPAKKPPVRKKRKIPRSGTPATFKALIGLVWIGLFVFFGGKYGTEHLTSDSYMQYNFIHRVFILYMTSLTARFKYYGVWSLTEGSCILAGLGYNGVDPVTGKVSWNRLQNIDPWMVETAQNPRAFLGGWNMNTNHWLRNYVYLRVTPRGKKPGFRASLMTFGTSALWHGFYPGYYLSFVLASFIQTAAKRKCQKDALGCSLLDGVDLLSVRLSASHSSLFPRPHLRTAFRQEALLRHRNLLRYPSHVRLRNRPFSHPPLPPVSPCLAPCLLLRTRVDRCVAGLFRLARESRAQEPAREEARQDQSQARENHQHGQPHRQRTHPGYLQGSRGRYQ